MSPSTGRTVRALVVSRDGTEVQRIPVTSDPFSTSIPIDRDPGRDRSERSGASTIAGPVTLTAIGNPIFLADAQPPPKQRGPVPVSAPVIPNFPMVAAAPAPASRQLEPDNRRAGARGGRDRRDRVFALVVRRKRRPGDLTTRDVVKRPGVAPRSGGGLLEDVDAACGAEPDHVRETDLGAFDLTIAGLAAEVVADLPDVGDAGRRDRVALRLEAARHVHRRLAVTPRRAAS